MNRISYDETSPSCCGGGSDSSRDVILADGSRRDVSGLPLAELERLQWEQDRDFAVRILEAPRRSKLRMQAVRQACETMPIIFSQMQAAAGRSGALGMDDRYALLVSKLLRRQRRRDFSPSFLEIGFGAGGMLKFVADEGYPVTGIEASQHLRDKAAELLGPAHENRLLVEDFLSHRPGAEHGLYSLIYWNDVFEHIPPDEIQDYIDKIHELLTPGGLLVTITPNWHVRPSDATLICHPPRTQARGLHLKEYTLREVSAALRRAGFTRVDVPLFLTRKNIFLAGGGFAGAKRVFEPALEWLPFRLAKILCRGFGLYCTIATK